MSDESIATRIEQLVSEEHKLQNRERADHADEDALKTDRERLRDVEIELDRCWDLLRQRRALRESGGDPESAQVRSEDTVEHYLQ
jgi:choline kinase